MQTGTRESDNITKLGNTLSDGVSKRHWQRSSRSELEYIGLKGM
jgi:hypothetical protein